MTRFRSLLCTIHPLLAVLAALLAVVSPAVAATLHALDASGLQRLLRAEPRQVLLLDVRTSGEFAGGRIPGSILIPMNQVPGRLSEVPRAKKVVAVCATGARSAAVVQFLTNRGYPWVVNLSGGVVDWSRRGLPLER